MVKELFRGRMGLVCLLALAAVVTRSAPRTGAQEKRPQAETNAALKHIEPNDATATSKAVVVGPSALAHTGQLLPVDRRGRVAKDMADAQVERLLDNLALVLAEVKSDFGALARLNVYIARDDLAGVVMRAFVRRFPRPARPAISFVTTRLPHPDALVALDAVACTPMSEERVLLTTIPGVRSPGSMATVAVLPYGARVHVSGQAEKGDLPTATRKTLESLRATLQHLRLSDVHVVQVKAFLTPMSDAEVVTKEVEAFYGKGKTPPLVLVEWKSGPQTPIEIELIAYAGRAYPSAPDVVEYRTPPGVTASPIYSRVCKVPYGPGIYLSGIHAAEAPDGKKETEDVLNQLKATLTKCGSDLNHLVKATYYVSTDESSKALNELRPRYYDPKRPPSASKAMVAGVGRAGRTLTLDMIAVPAMKVPQSKPEVGHGLTAEQAAGGWISLFDGKTTFGWKDAKVEDGQLSGGETTNLFGKSALLADFAAGGTITVGGKELRVDAGPFTLAETAGLGPIKLGPGVKVKSLILRPLGMKTIFDGRNLDDWKRIDRATIPEERRPKWRVEGGALVATGGPGAMEYQGARYGDLVLQIDVKTRIRHANGGVFFRSIPGDFMNGYEAQVYNRCEDGDPSKPLETATGGIDDRQNARRLVSRDFHYYRMTVLARGPHLATWINGHQVTDWTDPRKPDPNPRKGLRVEPGTIQLQAHDPLTDVEFRTIQVGN